MELNVLNEQVKHEAADAVFGREYNEALVHQIVVAYQANARLGTRAQLTRAEVHHSTKKPWRQKGTGRARSGMTSSPVWRHGGRAFPNKPDENFSQKVNKKMYRAGMATIFSKLVVSSVKLDTIAALFMVWVFVVIIEIIRNRGNVKKIFKDALALFQSMGKMFTGIVALIICAEFFATGLRESGLIDALINSAQGVGAGMGFMTVILTAIVSIVTFLTGSGVGAYSSFAALAPDVASGLGGSVEALVTPMQFASGMLRAMSPVAGVIIAVAGAAGVSPMAIVRRTWIPMILGLVTTIVVNQILFG